MKPINQLKAGLVLLGIGQALSGAAFAASVTMAGTSVDFTFDDALLGMFGPASVSGDTLYFTPTSFSAKSMNGSGYDLANGTLNVMMTAHSGQSFSTVDLLERGDYLLLGSGSTADVTGQIRAFDTAHPMTDITASIAPTSPLDQTGTPTHNWTATASANVAGWTGAQKINVTMENLLLASTSAPISLAFAEKKFIGLTSNMIATPVPEAENAAMMLAGLGLIGWTVGRRRSLTR